jgi:hypothetical protein
MQKQRAWNCHELGNYLAFIEENIFPLICLALVYLLACWLKENGFHENYT